MFSSCTDLPCLSGNTFERSCLQSFMRIAGGPEQLIRTARTLRASKEERRKNGAKSADLSKACSLRGDFCQQLNEEELLCLQRFLTGRTFWHVL
jgi:hypothetical protein